MKRERFTQESAREFQRYSATNAATVASELPCGCQPYEDVFTFKRWLAQGFVVKKGEKGVRIPVVIDAEVEDDDGKTKVRKIRKGSAVFCRHQVTPLKGTS